MARKTGPDRICTIDGCEKPLRARGYCVNHWGLWRRNGVPEKISRPTYEVCQAGECGKAPRSKHSEWCEAHYARLRRNGTLDVVVERVPDAICTVDWCGRKAERKDGLCRPCHARIQARGTPDYVGNRTPDDKSTYDTVHQRVRRFYGPASLYPCVDCEGKAQHWSYNHDDPDERLGRIDGKPYMLWFSLKMEHYRPRCAKCHKRFDMKRARDKNEIPK